MNTLNNILFFVDGAPGQKAALTRAADFARHASASLTIMAVVPKVSTDDERLSDSIQAIQDTLIRERKVELTKLIKEVPEAKRAVIDIVAGDKAFIEVIRAVVSEKFDLLIKAVDKPRGVKGSIFGSTDRRFLRQCPCPVWLIKNGKKKIRTVLAALDVTSNDKKTRRLSGQILEFAASVTKLEKANVHALSAWVEPMPPAMIRNIDTTALKEIKQAHKDKVLERFSALMASESAAGLDIDEHVLHGLAEGEIARFVEDYAVDLLVMGTLSRSGIPGLLIGNTAEKVLDEVNCSVLTLKPQGFRTVIK